MLQVFWSYLVVIVIRIDDQQRWNKDAHTMQKNPVSTCSWNETHKD